MEYVFLDASGMIRWDWTRAEPEVYRLWKDTLGGWQRHALAVDVYTQRVQVEFFSSDAESQKVGEMGGDVDA